MKWPLLFLIKIYQWCISPFLGPTCRFYPTCSEYSFEAIKTYGSLKGCWLTLKRLTKCHPWHHGGVDLVPSKHPPLASETEVKDLK